MLKKIGLAVVAILVVFLGYVATRPAHFHYERSGVINAPAEKIFPYLSDLKNGEKWSPYEGQDPSMKKTLTPATSGVGAAEDFQGDKSGSGRIEIMSVTPNQEVKMKLTMLTPFKAESLVTYTLQPEGAGTRFTWALSGDNGFMGKLFGVLVDCEKMMGADFEKGIQTLKTVVEGQK